MRFFGQLCGVAVMLFLVGCANGGAMRFEVGPNIEDSDFEESLEKLNQLTIVMSYSYGEVKFAPVASFSVENGRSLDVQRLIVMDGGIFLVSHNMVDDQFYPVVWFAYKQITNFTVDAQDIASGRLSQAAKFSVKLPNQDNTMTFSGSMWEQERASELLAFVSAKLEEK